MTTLFKRIGKGVARMALGFFIFAAVAAGLVFLMLSGVLGPAIILHFTNDHNWWAALGALPWLLCITYLFGTDL